jgi:AcrR family transcriptional regulator
MTTPDATSVPRTQRERVAESSRRLLTATAELIAQQGFANTTVAQIGKRGGYSHSMVHARYGSKDALIEALFREQWQARLLPDLDEGLTGMQRILGQIDQLIDTIRDERDLFRAVIVLAFEMPAHADTLKPWYQRWLQQYSARMVESFVIGERDGTIRTGLNHRQEAERFLTYGMGLCFMWSMNWDGYDMESNLKRWRRELKKEYGTASGQTPRRR